METLTISPKDENEMKMIKRILSALNVDFLENTEKNTTQSKSSNKSKFFSQTFGMWKDYDIDAKNLREEAWKRK